MRVLSRALVPVVLLYVLAAPSVGEAAVVFSYADMTMDEWMTVKTFQVTAEATHAADGDDPIGLLSPPTQQNTTRVSGEADVCIIADSFVESGRTRTHIREKACPRTLDGFRYSVESFEASVVGTVKTELWTQKWEVVGGRWVIVKDTTKTRSAAIDMRWRWTETPLYWASSCGPASDVAVGMGGSAVANGSITFNGAGVKARAVNEPGWLFVGSCVSPL